MAKNILRDIKPLTKVTKPAAVSEKRVFTVQGETRNGTPIKTKLQPPKKQNTFLWVIATIVIIAAIFSGMSIFARATIYVTPKTVHGTIHETITAIPGKDAHDLKPPTLIYEVMKLSDSISKTVPSQSTEQVSFKAQGPVRLYNNYGTQPVVLSNGTIFDTPDGKKFKITKAVSIPGMTGSNPGTVDVVVEAVNPGDSQNAKTADLYVHAFKGTAKYQKIYGRSTGPIEGGFVGVQFVADKGKVSAAQTELASTLEKRMHEQAKVELPDGYIAPDALMTFTVNPSKNAEYSTASDIPVKVDGTLSVVLIESKSLASSLAAVLDNTYNPKETVTLLDADRLLFSVDTTGAASIKNTMQSAITIDGDPHLTWKVSSSDVLVAGAGKTKHDALDIPNIISGIASVRISIVPPWIRTLPTKKSQLRVIIGDGN